MNKPRKYNGVYKLPIKKHTKVRRPMSRWKILLNIGTPVLFRIGISVNDISIGLEDPLWCIKYQSVWRREVFYAEPKPSLLTRVI